MKMKWRVNDWSSQFVVDSAEDFIDFLLRNLFWVYQVFEQILHSLDRELQVDGLNQFSFAPFVRDFLENLHANFVDDVFGDDSSRLFNVIQKEFDAFICLVLFVPCCMVEEWVCNRCLFYFLFFNQELTLDMNQYLFGVPLNLEFCFKLLI